MKRIMREQKFPNLKWLIHNANSIILRNLVPDNSVLNNLRSSRLELLCKSRVDDSLTLLYTSSVVAQGFNPSWTLSGLTSNKIEETVENQFEKYKIQLRIISMSCNYNSAEDEEEVLFTEELDLTRLIPLQYAILSGKYTVPINFIAINIDDRLYTTERVYAVLYTKGYRYAGEFFSLFEYDEEVREKTSDDDDVSINKTLNSQDNSTTTTNTNKLQMLRNNLGDIWNTAHLTRLQVIRESKQAELDKLKKELAMAEAELEEDEAALAAEQSAATSSEELSISMRRCQELMDLKNECDRTLNYKKMDLMKIKFLLEARQIKLLSDLHAIYPIERIRSGGNSNNNAVGNTDGAAIVGEYTIRGIELPNDLLSKDEEQVAAALGYVVHMILLARKYLEIPLRYQLLFMGSRSFIRDPVLGSAGTLPLFRRNVEKERFDRAVLWLRRCLEQLLITRGVHYEASQSILHNLRMLFQCEICPKLAM